MFPSLEKVIELVHKANGLTFLAHTFEYSSNIKNELDNIINNYNLDGLECFYTTFNEEQTNFLVNTCKRKHLYMSGGSDFHGFRKTNHELGNLNIDNKIIKSWIKNYL